MLCTSSNCMNVLEEIRQLLAKESSSFLQFTSFLARPRADGSAEDGLVKDVVGEFQGDEDKVMLDYCGMFKFYGKHLPTDFVCIEFQAASGESCPCLVQRFVRLGHACPWPRWSSISPRGRGNSGTCKCPG